MTVQKVQIVLHWSPTPPLSFPLWKPAENSSLYVALGPSLGYYLLLSLAAIRFHPFGSLCSEPKLSPASSLKVSKHSAYKENITEVKDGSQAFFHKVRSSAMLSVVSSKVLGSCRCCDLGIQIIILTSSPGRKETAFSFLFYSHKLCSTAEWSRYNLLGLSFILWWQNQPGSTLCFFS